MNMTHSVGKPDMEANKVKWLNRLCKQQLAKLSEEEYLWRQNLKVGDYCDAVARSPIPNCN